MKIVKTSCYNFGVIIDFHTHIFSPRVKKDPGHYAELDPGFAQLYSSPNPKMATAEELVAGMDKEGVGISVALNISWGTSELCIETNDYIMESMTRYPGRLVGFGSVPVGSPDAAIVEIERCARGGMRGIGEMRFDPALLRAPANDKIMKPFIEAIIEHNLILLTHASEPVGHQYAGKGNLTPEVLYPLITGFPDLQLVCAHWGGGLPFYALMPEVKQALNNVYFDTAASPFLYRPRIYQHVAQIVGPEKILFGTDYPLLPPHRLLKEIDSLDLPEETKTLILSGNARRLLGLDQGRD
ncbi:MAG: amidohydrolase family protein [Chloroflexota bacterium]